MDALANKGKYKVIDRLAAREGYEAFTAVDIEEREQGRVLVNLYGDPADVRRLLPLFYRAAEQGCPGLLEIFTEYGRFGAAFREARGEPLLAAAKTGLPPALRRELVERVFLQALALSLLPEELANSLLSAENFLVSLDSRRVSVRMLAPPERFLAGDAALLAVGRLCEALLCRRFCSLREELDFLDALRAGSFGSVGAAYAAWRAFCAGSGEALREHEAKNGASLLLYGLRTWAKRRKAVRELRARYRY